MASPSARQAQVAATASPVPPAAPLVPGDRFSGSVSSFIWKDPKGYDPRASMGASGYFFVRGPGLPESGLYCPANEHRDWLLVVLGCIKSKPEGCKISAKELFEFFRPLYDVAVSGLVESSAKGPEGRRLCFQGLAATSTYLQRLSRLDMTTFSPARLTVEACVRGRAAPPPLPPTVEGGAAMVVAWVKESEENAPDKFDIDEAEEHVVRLMQRYLINADACSEKVSVLAGRINQLYLNRRPPPAADIRSSREVRGTEWREIINRRGTLKELCAAHTDLFLLARTPHGDLWLELRDRKVCDPASLPPARPTPSPSPHASTFSSTAPQQPQLPQHDEPPLPPTQQQQEQGHAHEDVEKVHMEASAERQPEERGQEASQSRWVPPQPPHPPPHPNQLLLPRHQPARPVEQAPLAPPYWRNVQHMQAEAGADGGLDSRLAAAPHVLPPHLEHTSPPYATAAGLAVPAHSPLATFLAPTVPPPLGASGMNPHHPPHHPLHPPHHLHHMHHMHHPHHQAMHEHPSPATPDSRFPMQAQVGAAQGAEAWQALDAANAPPFHGVRPRPHGAAVQHNGPVSEEAATAGGMAYLEMLPPQPHASAPRTRVLCIAQLDGAQLEAAVSQLHRHQQADAVLDAVEYMRMYHTEVKAQDMGLMALFLLSLHGNDMRNTIAQTALHTVLQAMSTHRDALDTQARACGALYSLAISPGARPLLRTESDLLLLDSLRRYRSGHADQRVGGLVLKTLKLLVRPRDAQASLKRSKEEMLHELFLLQDAGDANYRSDVEELIILLTRD